jgi:hypothetical protein
MPITSRYDATENRYVRDDTLNGSEKTLRTRVTVAQLNAGFTLLPALPGFIYAMVDCMLIAVGGAATTGTSVNVIGTRAAAPVQLFVAAVAGLTQSTVLRAGSPFATAGTASIVCLANGASFTPLDVNTAVTVITVGSAMTVMTDIDVTLEYTVTPA